MSGGTGEQHVAVPVKQPTPRLFHIFPLGYRTRRVRVGQGGREVRSTPACTWIGTLIFQFVLNGFQLRFNVVPVDVDLVCIGVTGR